MLYLWLSCSARHKKFIILKIIKFLTFVLSTVKSLYHFDVQFSFETSFKNQKYQNLTVVHAWTYCFAFKIIRIPNIRNFLMYAFQMYTTKCRYFLQLIFMPQHTESVEPPNKDLIVVLLSGSWHFPKIGFANLTKIMWP